MESVSSQSGNINGVWEAAEVQLEVVECSKDVKVDRVWLKV